MTTSQKEKSFSNPRPATTSGAYSGVTGVKDSPFFRFEQAVKLFFRPTVQAQRRKDNITSTSVHPSSKNLSTSVSSHTPPTPVKSATKAVLSTSPTSPAIASHPWLCIFPQNIAAPSPTVSLPPKGTRIETTVQLAYCNHVLRTQLSPSSAALSITRSLNSAQQAVVDTILQNAEEQSRINWLTTRVVEEFVADSSKTSDKITEVIFLGPFLDQVHYRQLLNCLIAELESSQLLDIDLLARIAQLVQCAGSDYLLPDDLIRILVVIVTRPNQKTARHPCCLLLALSRLFDVIVEGKVQDITHAINQESLLIFFHQFSSNKDPSLRHQAAYAMQALLHIPIDETRRQFMLRQAGNTVMGLLGVASVCKLDLSEFKDDVDHLYRAAGDVHEVATNIVDETHSLLESGQDIATIVNGSILSGGRMLWFSGLREAKDHIRNGRLADFNRLIFEAPCHRDIEFQWGICELLGEIMVDACWDMATRQHAIDLIAELYKDESTWTISKEVSNLILQLFVLVIKLPGSTVSDYALSVVQYIEEDNEYIGQDILDAHLSPYALRAAPPIPASSMLLAQVQSIPDVEYDIYRMKTQRLKEREHTLYIPPLAKPTLQASNDTLFPLMKHALDFLSSPGQVLLLLGDSGGGKSTFNLLLERTLWQAYKRGGAIPLHINLPTLDKPQEDMIVKQLQHLHLFTEAQIQELRQSREFIVICDGYDESRLRENLYTTNQINRPGQWRAKMIISCRSQYLGSDYRLQFQPTMDRYSQATPESLQQAVIAPFSRRQIEQYVEQYVQQMLPFAVTAGQPAWDVEDFMDKLVRIPHLIELVSNPFLLTLALRSLPRVVRSKQDLSVIRLTRVELYDSFIEDWLENNKSRLADSRLSSEAQSIFDMIRDEGFVPLGISYQKDLSAAIFQHQAGNPVVEYSHLRERLTWKASFFSPDLYATIFREASPLTRSGNQFRFIHRSILEYLYSRVMSDPFDSDYHTVDGGSGNEELTDSFLNHPLNQRSIVEEPSILQFLAERVELNPMFKERLRAAIEASKTDATISKAAANAISILVKAGVRFNGADLRGVKIPGADLCGGEFDLADMGGADLSNVNLSKAWLRQSNLSKAQLTGVQFGELSYIALMNFVASIVFSNDGKFLAVSLVSFTIHIYDTTTWDRIVTYLGGKAIAASPVSQELAKAGRGYAVEVGDILTGKPRLVLKGHDDIITCICYSSDGTRIATASKDTTVRICSTVSGETLHVLSRHSYSVTGIAFSPDGRQLLSCSETERVQVWDTETGKALAELSGNDQGILCMAYSPDGRQIAAVGNGWNAWLWNAHTMKLVHVLNYAHESFYSVAFSPDGYHIAFGGGNGSVCLYDSHSGELLSTLLGHTHGVESVTYSPSGDYIASGALDGCVRLWKTSRAWSDSFSGGNTNDWVCIAVSENGQQTATGGSEGEVQLWETLTGELGAVLKGHTGYIGDLAFSLCGEQVASTSRDGTVRQWCTQTGAALHVFDNLSKHALGIAFSPSGHQIIAAGEDNSWNFTVRLWNALTGKPGLILKGHTDRINNVVYSPDGHRIAASSRDGTVRVWNADTGEQLFALEHPKEVYQVMYSPDGQELISISMLEYRLRCWESQSGELLDRDRLYGFGIISCCYSPDGNYIATVSLDGYLRLWDRRAVVSIEVFRTAVKVITRMNWKQSSDHVYLTTKADSCIRVWQLVEKDDTFGLRLLWSLNKKELSLSNANLCGAVGLSLVDLKLAEQRGATTDLHFYICLFLCAILMF